MKITVEKKPANTGGPSSRDIAGQGENTELHLQIESCVQTQKNASGSDSDKGLEVCRQVANSLSVVIYGRRDQTCSLDRAVQGPNLDDLDLVRDLVDLAGAGRVARDKYRQGRLAGVAVSWCRSAGAEPRARIEVFGPLCDEGLDLDVVDWLDDDLPAYGWRCSTTNTLHRIPDMWIFAHLVAEARERGLLEVEP